MTALFISDLHLDPKRPGSIDDFERFVAERALRAERVYVLGDLFEAWIGDDDDEPELARVLHALARLGDAGVPCAVMHGNRDFLIGERFARATGCRLLGDYELVEVHGARVLLTHGDLLCTDDVRYLELRSRLRDPLWQRDFLAKPLRERREIAAALRQLSATEMAEKPEQIMDVNQDTVERVMREHGVEWLLHGHTHRPAIHRFTLDGRPAMRIVLGAWYESPAIAWWDAAGPRLETL
ncbi:MAG TPA: UDP-2,3-diacylglucosamine diphosphatase [Gammaproteobacteria bacterium]